LLYTLSLLLYSQPASQALITAPPNTTTAAITCTVYCSFLLCIHRWGCPRGRGCDFAHGEEELKGDEATATKKRKADSEKAQVRTSVYTSHSLFSILTLCTYSKGPYHMHMNVVVVVTSTVYRVILCA
jgi:hypothetical protein